MIKCTDSDEIKTSPLSQIPPSGFCLHKHWYCCVCNVLHLSNIWFQSGSAIVRLVLRSPVRPEVVSLRPGKQPLSSGLDDKSTALIIDYRPRTKHPRRYGEEPSLSSCWKHQGRKSFPVRDASRFPVGQNGPSGSVSLMCAFLNTASEARQTHTLWGAY